jgi:hypothetical protein
MAVICGLTACIADATARTWTAEAVGPVRRAWREDCALATVHTDQAWRAPSARTAIGVDRAVAYWITEIRRRARGRRAAHAKSAVAVGVDVAFVVRAVTVQINDRTRNRETATVGPPCAIRVLVAHARSGVAADRRGRRRTALLRTRAAAGPVDERNFTVASSGIGWQALGGRACLSRGVGGPVASAIEFSQRGCEHG